MIQKSCVQIFVLVLYWIVITPLVIVLCLEQKWVVWDDKNMFSSFKQFCVLGLCLAACYPVAYLLIVLIYLRIRTWTMTIWVKYDPATIEMINQERQYYADNDPRLDPNQDNASTTLDMEDDELDGHQSLNRAPNVPRPVEKVHQKQPRKENRKQKRQHPPSYEECNN